MLEKRAKSLPWGLGWTAEGAAGERWCGGTEIWSWFSTRPSFLRHCRATLHVHNGFFPASGVQRDLVKVHVVFGHCTAVTRLVCVPCTAKAGLPAPHKNSLCPGWDLSTFSPAHRHRGSSGRAGEGSWHGRPRPEWNIRVLTMSLLKLLRQIYVE